MSRGTLDSAVLTFPSLTGLSPSLAGLSRTFLLESSDHIYADPNPCLHADRFGLFPVRSPLLRKSSFLSFPPAT